MKRIAIVTATRAEYGLLSGLIRKIREYESDDFRAELIVTGTHLSEKYGNTIKEIAMDEHRIDFQIVIPVLSNTEIDISNNQAETLKIFTKLFVKQKFDAIVLLGDRYETLAIAIAAGNTHIPIFHIAGGDTTEGAIDEWIRHSITKMSYMHFATSELSKKRVIQMGEQPTRVFNFGSLSIDNVLMNAFMSKTEALASIGLLDCSYAICTYHPVTMGKDNIEENMGAFLDAIRMFPSIDFIVTKSNADQGGQKINLILEEAEKRIDNLHVYASLGVTRYLSLMKHAEFVMGNSSSGIVEAPALKIPTVNIGNRQKGREKGESVVDCKNDVSSIACAIKQVLDEEFRIKCHDVTSPYGDGTAAINMSQQIYRTVMEEAINLQKVFYTI